MVSSGQRTMIDLHTHTFLSDGVLVPAELTRRCMQAGYKGLVITDHCDHSNLQFIVESIRRFCDAVRGEYGELQVLPGCELTHVPPALIPGLVECARSAGAEVVVVHGETIVEPVAEGTNRAAIEGGADVIGHPGLITEQEAAMAAEKGVLLEISGRKGHAFTNGHVARIALSCGARLSFGSDGHAPGEFHTRSMAERIAAGAGLTKVQVTQMFDNCAAFFGQSS